MRATKISSLFVKLNEQRLMFILYTCILEQREYTSIEPVENINKGVRGSTILFPFYFSTLFEMDLVGIKPCNHLASK